MAVDYLSSKLNLFILYKHSKHPLVLSKKGRVLVILLLWLTMSTYAQKVNSLQAPDFELNKKLWNYSTPRLFGESFGITDHIVGAAEDHHGFIWAASLNKGLYRFDGTSATIVPIPKEFSDNLYSINSDSSNHCLWLGAQGGLLKFDLKAWKFEFFLPSTSWNVDDSNISFRKTVKLGDTLWICTSSGLALFDIRHSSFKGLYADPMVPNQLDEKRRANDYKDIRLDPNQPNKLWLGSEWGLASFDLTNYTFHRFINEFQVEDLAAIRVFPTKGGGVYIGSRIGFGYLEPKTGEAKIFRLAPGTPVNSAVYSISELNENQLLIGYRDGLAVVDISKNRFCFNIPKSTNQHVNQAYFFKDKSGNWWGGNDYGLLSITPSPNIGKVYLPPVEDTGLSQINYQSLKLPDNRWVAVANTNTQGNLLFDLHEKRWQKVSFDDPKISNNFIAAVLLQDGRTLISDNKGFLLTCRFPADKKLIPFEWQAPNSALIVSLFQDRAGRIWIGTYSYGLFCLQQEGESWKVRHFLKEIALHENGQIYVAHLVEDAKGNIWGGGTDKYFVWNKLADTITCFPHHKGNPFSPRMIRKMLCDTLGNIWMFDEEKIVLIEPDDFNTGGSRVFYSGKEIRSSGIQSALEDQSGNIWVFSSRGIECIRNGSFETTMYPHAKISTLNRVHHVIQLPDKQFLIACNHRIVLIHPDSLAGIEHTWGKPFVSKIKVAGREFQLNYDPFELKEISLAAWQNVLTFEFSALNFDQPDQVQFFYKMEGVDPDWQIADASRQATYVNLPSGKLLLKVQVFQDNYGYSPSSFNLKIFIATPWYRTWWAYGIYIAIVIGIITVVYQIQLRRQEAQAETKRLIEYDTFKSRFFTNFTHEFRTPLTLIIGLAEKAEQENSTIDATNASVIRKSGEQILNLVNQILDLAKLDAGSLTLNKTEGDFIAELRSSTVAFESLANMKQIQLSFLSDEMSYNTEFDHEKLRQIASNLISNALKFTPAQGTVQVIVESHRTPGRIYLKVQDSGPGIKWQDAEMVFERFFQADTVIHGGTGIGLAIVKEYAVLMGGNARVGLQEGEGALIEVWFPAENPVTESTRSPVSLTVSKADPLIEKPQKTLNEKPQILIVEDHHDLAFFISKGLGASYQYHFADNGQKGWHAALDLTPDLIISDVMMPEMDGITLTSLLKTDFRTDHIPLILLTAKSDLESRLTGLRGRADAYLSKPFVIEELRQLVENFLERQKLLRNRFSGNKSLFNFYAEETRAESFAETAFLSSLLHILEEKALDSKFGVPELCRALGMSASQLHRKLQFISGNPPGEIIATFRLEKASYFLKANRHLSISEIAFSCGFNDPDYFSRAFSKHFGIPPSKWREQQS